MKKLNALGLALLVAVGGLTQSAWAFVYAESGDAQQTLPGQATGSGVLEAITGDFGPANGQNPVLDADIYAIALTAGLTFTATVVEGPGATPIFDSALSLFDINGNGVLFNDDISVTNAFSSLSFTPTADGVFYLAISTTPYFARDTAGTFIFPDTTAFPGASPTGIYQPNSSVGPLASWAAGAGGSTGDFGSYRINLTNASAVPEPYAGGTGMVVGLGVLGGIARRRGKTRVFFAHKNSSSGM